MSALAMPKGGRTNAVLLGLAIIAMVMVLGASAAFAGTDTTFNTALTKFTDFLEGSGGKIITVMSLAGGIVDRRGEAAIARDPLDQQQLAMAAGHEQQQIGEGEIGIGQPRAERMPLQMVDRDQRLADRMRQRLAGDEADHDAADQAGAGGGGDRVDRIETQPGIGERATDERFERLDMRARGDFGDDAAERRMRRLLPGEAVAEHAPVAGHERGGGLVAGGFEAEDDPGSHARFPSGTRRGCRRGQVSS